MEKDKLGAGAKISTKSLDFIITGVVVAVFLLTPMFFTGLVAQGIGFEKVILFYFLTLIGAVAWVVKGAIVGELRLKRTPLDLPILVSLLLLSISAALSISSRDSLIGNYGNSIKGLVAFAMFAFFYYLVINNLDTKRMKYAFWALIFSSFLLVLYSVLQLQDIFIIKAAFASSAKFNPLGSLSGLTRFLTMILPLFVVAATKIDDMVKCKSKYGLIALRAFLILGILGIFIVLHRLNGFTYWPIGIVGMVIVMMFFLSKIIKIKTSNLLIPLLVFLGLIISLVLGVYDSGLDLPAEVSLSRGASWNIAKSSLAENPIFGSGPSTFYYDFAKFRSSDFNSSPLWNIRFDSASGILFELLATVGVLGTVSILVLVLVGLSVSFLSLIKSSDDENGAMMLSLFAAFVSVIFFSLLFSLNNSVILLGALISILAVALAIVGSREEYKVLRLSFRASPKYSLALAAIVLCVSAGVVILFTMGVKMYLADIHIRKSMELANNSEKIIEINKAIQLAPYQDSYYLSAANSYMALANSAAREGADKEGVGANLSTAIEQGKKAVEIAPKKAGNNESLALIYENASFYTRGALDWAENLYNDVIKLDPNNPTAYLRMALVNMAKANMEKDDTEKKYFIEEAIKRYDEAIQKKTDLAAAYYGKAVAYEKLGNNDAAIQELKNANLVAINNVEYRFELGRMFYNRGVSPSLSQSDDASRQIAENEMNPNATSTGNALSVNNAVASDGVVTKSDDIGNAEKLFLSILTENPKHANACYSLAVLYQKVGENDNAKIMVNKLLEIVDNEKDKEAIRGQFQNLLK